MTYTQPKNKTTNMAFFNDPANYPIHIILITTLTINCICGYFSYVELTQTQTPNKSIVSLFLHTTLTAIFFVSTTLLLVTIVDFAYLLLTPPDTVSPTYILLLPYSKKLWFYFFSNPPYFFKNSLRWDTSKYPSFPLKSLTPTEPLSKHPRQNYDYIRSMLQRATNKRQNNSSLLNVSSADSSLQNSLSSIIDLSVLDNASHIYSIKKTNTTIADKNLYLNGLNSTYTNRFALSDNSLRVQSHTEPDQMESYILNPKNKTILRSTYSRHFIENQSLRTFIKFKNVLNSKPIHHKILNYRKLVEPPINDNLSLFIKLLDDLSFPDKFSKSNFFELFYCKRIKAEEKKNDFDKKKYLANLFGDTEYTEVKDKECYKKVGEVLRKFGIKMGSEKVNEIIKNKKGIFVIKVSIFGKENEIMIESEEKFYVIINERKQAYFVKAENGEETVVKLFVSFCKEKESTFGKVVTDYLNK